jgi:RimJ/RimL family protein N-acetyltransferase
MAPAILNVTIECARPHELARFWAAALGRPIAVKTESANEVGVPLDEQGRVLLFQGAPEPKIGKNRQHLCLQPDQPRDVEIERMVGLGATVVDNRQEPDRRGWVVMRDPEGNEFYLSRSATERGQPPRRPARTLSIRPMEVADFAVRVAYFHDASDEHLNRLGVDRARLPDPREWQARFAADTERPLELRTEYGVVWELNGAPVGFSTADQIQFGVEAHMHLHITDPARRAAGLGASFVRLTAAHYCELLDLDRVYCEPNAFNVAPNRALQNAGFRYLRSRQCRPAPINSEQTTTIWMYEPTRP